MQLLCISLTLAIAKEAEKYRELLVPDEGAEYDRLIEINLDEVSSYCLPLFVPLHYLYASGKCY